MIKGISCIAIDTTGMRLAVGHSSGVSIFSNDSRRSSSFFPFIHHIHKYLHPRVVVTGKRPWRSPPLSRRHEYHNRDSRHSLVGDQRWSPNRCISCPWSTVRLVHSIASSLSDVLICENHCIEYGTSLLGPSWLVSCPRHQLCMCTAPWILVWIY